MVWVLKRHFAMEAAKRIHSLETKETAAAEFLNSIYVLEQRCRGVKCDI